MFGFLIKTKPKKARKPVIAPESVTSTKSGQHSNIQRELIRVVLKDTMRLHGIPLDWLACEPIVVPRSNRADVVNIQLVVMRWSDKLMQFALALEQQLLLGLDRFDPAVDHSGYVVSWRFSPACGNPVTHMPNPKYWLQNDQPPNKVEPISVLDRRQTLRPQNAQFLEPSLFDTYDKPSSFQATDVLPLR